MSYILNALRKSEQERQANRPETLTEQVLTPPAPKSRKIAIVIGALLAVNLLALLLLVWYLKKTDDTPAAARQADARTLQQKAARKPQPGAVKPANTDAPSEKAPAAAAPVPEVINPSAPTAAAPAVKSPSIEELAAASRAAEVKGPKQAMPDKPERGAQTVPSTAATGARELARKERQTRRAQPVPAAESPSDSESDAGKGKSDASPAAGRQDIPLFKDLPYNFRSSVPKMAINVFMYTDNPADRFVILNMTKYKAGQTTKDAIEIREIRPDGVIASYGGKVFRIERP
jgi:general secretion pathway protein B